MSCWCKPASSFFLDSHFDNNCDKFLPHSAGILKLRRRRHRVTALPNINIYLKVTMSLSESYSQNSAPQIWRVPLKIAAIICTVGALTLPSNAGQKELNNLISSFTSPARVRRKTHDYVSARRHCASLSGSAPG